MKTLILVSDSFSEGRSFILFFSNLHKSYSGLIVGTDGDKLGGTRNRSRPTSGDGGGTAGTYALLQLPGEFLVWHEDKVS